MILQMTFCRLKAPLHSHGLEFHSRVLLCDSMTGPHGHFPHGHVPHGHDPHIHYPHWHFPHVHFPFEDLDPMTVDYMQKLTGAYHSFLTMATDLCKGISGRDDCDANIFCRWNNWGGWTPCWAVHEDDGKPTGSQSCGVGLRYRVKTHNGACQGTGSGKTGQGCKSSQCGSECWENWGGWTTCQGRCGQGKKARMRNSTNHCKTTVDAQGNGVMHADGMQVVDCDPGCSESQLTETSGCLYSWSPWSICAKNNANHELLMAALDPGTCTVGDDALARSEDDCAEEGGTWEAPRALTSAEESTLSGAGGKMAWINKESCTPNGKEKRERKYANDCKEKKVEKRACNSCDNDYTC